MTDATDILGRKPILKPRLEIEEQPDLDWRGERFITRRTIKRQGNKFTLSNALRKAHKP